MDPDYIPPPPAYSEQEFDQKISQATVLSLDVSQANIDADGWPQYDPTVFEAISASEGSSTSPTAVERSSSVPMETSVSRKGDYVQHDDLLPSIVPLRIEKKNQKKSLAKPPAISQPRNGSSCLTIGENSLPGSGTCNRDDFRSQSHAVPNTCAGDDLSLLSLTTVPVHSTQIANKRDGSLFLIPPPPFEAQPPACPPESSLPVRPLVYSHDNHDQHHIDPRNVSPSQSPRHSLPIQSRPRFVPQERTMTSYPSHDNFQPSYVPHLAFNPSIAYGRTQPTTPSTPLKQSVKNVQYDPHAFYNSAVSAQITPNISGQHGHSSYNSRNSFSPQRQYQQQGPLTTYSRPGHYSQSFVSQDPLLLERSTSPFDMNSSRPSVLQSPARPSSSYSMSSNYQAFNASPSPVYPYVNHTNIAGNIYYDQQSADNRWSTG